MSEAIESVFEPAVLKCLDDLRDLLNGITEALYEQFVDDRTWGIYHRLTLYVLELVQEHTLGMISEFEAERPHSALALYRCAFEGAVRLKDWYGDEDKALRDWDLLPVAAYEEERRKAPEGHAENVAPGVRRDYQAYLIEHPELAEFANSRDDFRSAAERVFIGGGMSDAKFRSYYEARYGVPSLFVHARLLGIEDFFEVTEVEWKRKSESSKSEPNYWSMNLVAVLLDICNGVVKRYGLNVGPVDDVGRTWELATVALHRP